jgi:hypothetical protein
MKHDGSENVLISFWLSHENLSESISLKRKRARPSMADRARKNTFMI